MSLKRIKNIKFGTHYKVANLVWSDNKTISAVWNKRNKHKKDTKRSLCGLCLSVKGKTDIHVSTNDTSFKPASILMHELIHCMDDRVGMPDEGSTELLVEERGRILLEFIMENKSLIKSLWNLYRV